MRVAAALYSAQPPHAARVHSRRSCAAVLASNLVVKGLTARPKTVTRASDALLLLVELDAAEATVARAREARAALAQLPASERVSRRCASGLPCGDAAPPRTSRCCAAGGSVEGASRQSAEGRGSLRRGARAGRQVRSPPRAAGVQCAAACAAAWRDARAGCAALSTASLVCAV